MKISEPVKKEIERIANIEKMLPDDLIATFIHSSINNYWKNGSLQMNSFDWSTFRDNLRKGDKVIASGFVGTIKEKTDSFCLLEICHGVEVEVMTNSISDKKLS